MLKDIIYKRTYAREGEEWPDTIARVCRGLKSLGWWGNDLPELESYMLSCKGLVSGRALWQLGAPKFTGDSLQNCWCVKVNKVDSFLFCFNELMLGGGVGFNIKAEHVYELRRVRYRPKVVEVDSFDCDLVVCDNREGWIKLVKKVFDSFFFTGRDLRFSVKCVRGAGSKIKGFGGVASGPEALVRGVLEIVKVLSGRFDNKLRPLDCLDVMNIIGTIVVSGNVRRSSEIAIGDSCDNLFIEAKVWPYPGWRGMSNNSCACDRISEFCGWDSFKSDPLGLVNLRNLRRYGRLADGVDYRPDPGIIGCNPCGEIGLEDREPCNLAEIFLPNISSEAEFIRVGELLLKACKLITCAEFHDPVTQEVVSRNRRVGVGIAGLAQVDLDMGVLDRVYRRLEVADIEYSRVLGINNSLKLTTIKPGGTMCLLAGVTPGMGDAVGEYVIRRVRFSSSDPLLDRLSWAGYDIEPLLNMDGSIDSRTGVVGFPVRYKGARVNSGVTKLLDLQVNLQRYWSDNCISCTHNYRESEIPEIRAWLERNYDESVKTTCFSPFITGFRQMPIEAINREVYLELCDNKKVEIIGGDDVDMDCEGGGACPVK